MSTRSIWIRAVTLGSRGAIARGSSLLDEVELAVAGPEGSRDRALCSLILSTRASWLRQSGRHALALGPDGRAALIATGAPLACDDDGWGRGALGDALIGLSADHLGLGRFDASSRLLDRAHSLIAGARPATEWLVGGRVALRWHWVCAENALYRGDVQAGLRWADEGVRLAQGGPSPYHRIKSQLIAAAATAAAGDSDRSATQAREVIAQAINEQFLPLQWAGWHLLAGLDPSPAVAEEICRATVALGRSGFFPSVDFSGGSVDR